MAYKDKMSVEEMMEQDDLLKKKPTREQIRAYKEKKAKEEAEAQAKEDNSFLGGFKKTLAKLKPSEPARQATEGVKNLEKTIEEKKKQKKYGIFEKFEE
jgi:hypothetical protein